MKKSDYFAEFRLVFCQIVKQQEADSTLQLLHFRFIAPMEEVAQTAKLARMAIDLGPGEENENFAIIPFLMFVIKMFDGIVDKSVDPLQLDFTATEWEYEQAILTFEIITKICLEAPNSRYADKWTDPLILINTFIKRIEYSQKD
jgi:hypothetical protein